MKSSIRKITILLSLFIASSFFVTPVTKAAQECDKDGDGYIVIPTETMKLISPDISYDQNGNYSPAQWQDFYNLFVNGQDKLTEDEKCLGLNFKKGAEPSRCDDIVIGSNSGVFDPSKVTTTVSGASVNPGAFDIPGNGIDENCDGKDATLTGDTGTSAANKDLGGLTQKALTLLSQLVIVASIAIMVWGGFLYATAAGDEAKVSKARKAIIGAVIGLIVGLLAPTVVHLIAANLS
jgi:Type IV secretion system pilin